MNTKSANIFLFIALFCVSFFSFSQDEGLILLEDSDDKLIQFENHYFEALKHKAIGNYTRAITELEKCQQLFPDDASVAFELSKNYFLLKKFFEAELYIVSALKAEPDNYWFLEQVKNVYTSQYNYTKAIEVQEKVVIQNPSVTEDLVLLYIQANEHEKAQKLIDELDSEGITSSRLRHYKEVLKNYNQPKKVVQKVVETSNNSLDELKQSFEKEKQFIVLKEILEQEFAAENFENLLKYSQEGVELFPAQPAVYLMNGKSLIHQKKYNEAIDVLEMGIDFVVDDLLEADFYEQLANCYVGLNQTEKATKNRQKAAALRKTTTN